MKKLLFIYLVIPSFTSLHVEARKITPPTVCRDNNWVDIYVDHPRKDASKVKGSGSTYAALELCILPNGNYYPLWDLEDNKQTKYKELFKQYSGKPPSTKQLQQVKQKLKENGYIVYVRE